MAHPVKVGQIGLGTIGTGVADLFLYKMARIAERSAAQVELAKIVTLPPLPDDLVVPDGMISEDINDILDDPKIKIVIELIGGLEPARTFVLGAISKGKSVVTANKALLAAHGEEIFEAADKMGVGVSFEASVGGSIPIIRALQKSLIADEIQSLFGILNGTTNYILTRMTEEQLPYDQVLQEAQSAGFAEANPTADVEGHDARDKLVILLRLAFGSVFSSDQLLCEGISQIAPIDVQYAQELGYTIKLLAIAKRRSDGIEARVHPALVPSQSLIANVRLEYNAVELVGDGVDTQLFYGKGAGRKPTASVIVADVMALAERAISGTLPSISQWLGRDGSIPLVSKDELLLKCYLRLEVVDQVGVLEEIARVLASEQISIETVQQKSKGGPTVPLVILTHEAGEAALSRAIGQLNSLDTVRSPVQMIRLENI